MKTIVVLLSMAATSASAQVNLLENPGFETGSLEPWFQLLDFGGDEDWNVSDADANTGAFSATNRGNKLVVQDIDPTPTGDILEVSAWVRNPEVSINSFYFAYSDGSDEQWTYSHSSSEWTFYDATSRLDPGKELVTIGMWGYAGGGPDPDRTYIDDFQVLVAGGGCPADLDGDGDADADDFFTYLDAFASGDQSVCDIDGDGDCDADDFFGYLDLFAQGC